MAATLTGTVKYARHMQGDNNGNPYNFFSFVVLDNDEGERWPLQVQEDHPQFKELCQGEQALKECKVEVVIRAFSSGMKKKAKDSQEKEPTTRFYAKSVRVLSAAAGATTPAPQVQPVPSTR